MAETLWKPSLVLALYRNRQAPSSRFVQMATVRADGRPCNRTLVFRGFLDETPRLTFVTDARSAKVAELDRSPWAEACWYFPVTHDQFRITGTVRAVRDDDRDRALLDARRQAWSALEEPTRVSFAWPSPGERRDYQVPFHIEHPDPENPLPHFCLLLLEPQEVDHLELNGNPQNRWKYTRGDDGGWSGVEINP